MDFVAIQEFLNTQKYPAFRLDQIIKNYFSGHCSSFEQMSDLPQDLRQDLTKNFDFISVDPVKTSSSAHTKKALLKLKDGQSVETVLMNYDNWITACLSTQVGCSLGCKFCATGQMGFKRNLSPQEMVDQVVYWNNKIFPAYVGRVVFMGMGEPFLNWDNLIEALSIINSKKGLSIGQRKISISTAGIVDRIYDFADLQTQVNLAISLHSLKPKTRLEIMPLTKKHSLPDLIKSSHYYVKTTNRQLFFEYALIKDLNDRQSDLSKLIDFINSHHLFFVNLIPLNQTNSGLKASSPETIDHWTEVLTKAKVNFSLRRSLGDPVDAACGQLHSSNDNKRH